MRGLQKKRISWASDVNLCQVRLFLSEESPSQVGLDAQDHLQAKTTVLLHSNGMGSDDNLPPGFEGAHSASQLNNILSQIPLIDWKCPPRIMLNVTWQVVSGEESKEVEVQNQREMRVLEAVYPRPSAIPSDPAVLADLEGPNQHDWQTPVIPVTPIEDEDAAGDSSYDFAAPVNNPVNSQPSPMAHGFTPASSQFSVSSVSNLPASDQSSAGTALGVESDAAAAALTAMMKSNEQGNLIDHELLIKILSNPNLIEKLVTDYGPATTSPHTLPKPILPPVNLSNPHPAQINRIETGTSSTAATASGPFYSQPNGVMAPGSIPRPLPPGLVPVSSQPSVGAPKDVNYYKTLIQQHGGERQETIPQGGGRHNHQLEMDSINIPKPRDSKQKKMIPCHYFNSSRGCRHGANCVYQHDESVQQRVNSIPEVQSAKRMKLDREITGT